MKTSITKNKVISLTLSTSSILLIIFIWMIISTIYNEDTIFPSIPQIATSLINIFKSKSALIAILMTILRVILSVLISFIIGFIILEIYILLPKSIHFFKPIITLMRSTPIAIISIFIFILIGSKIGPYIITLLMTLPVVLEGLITSTNEINKDIIDEVKTLQGSSFIKIKKIYIPIILPYIIMTFIQSLGMSFKVMIMGEYICQTKNSIGKIIYDIKSWVLMADLIAYGILIVIIVTIIEQSVKIIKGMTK